MRNALALVGKAHQDFVAAALRTIFLQPDKESAKAQLRQVADNFCDRFPKLVELLEEAAEDVLAYMSFPSEHRRQIHSTNPLERLNYEVKRRADVVGIFPNRSAAIRLLGSVLQEQNDEVASWSEQTITKLKQVLTKCLIETEMLDNVRDATLNPIFISAELESGIRENNDLGALAAFNCFR
jgi:transposase-like protein